MAVATPPAPQATETPPARARRPGLRAHAPATLGAALVAILGYAVFARGATGPPAESYGQMALAAVGLLACAVGLGSGALVIRTSRSGWTALALLTAFAFYNGVSLLWTVTPQGTWLETNRALAYALLLALALAVGSSARLTLERVALGWLWIAVLAALYALGGKIAPGVHAEGLFHLNHTAVFSRLRAPLYYWNALALMCVLAAPVAIHLSTDRSRGERARLAGLGALHLLLVVGGLTYSRGGVLAMVFAIVLLTALGGARLRGLVVIGTAAVAAVGPLAFAFSRHALTTDSVALGVRVREGRVLALVMLASMALLLGAGHWLVGLERRGRWSPARSRRAWRLIGGAAGVGVLVALGVLAVSPRCLSGSITHQIDTFTSVRKDPIGDPSRLLSTSSGNRWVWWKEAAGAFSDRPVAGWGPGSFPATHLLYRKPPLLPVRQPHSVPLQFLAETGIVGALLALGAIASLLAAAAGRVRWMVPGRRRDLGAACLVSGSVWALHGFYDWDWDIPGVTFPALVLLGVLAARPVDGRLGAQGPPAEGQLAVTRERAGLAPRAAGLALATVVLFAFAVSALLPAWSHTKALNALTAVGGASSPAALQHAAAQADLASRLNPLGDEATVDAATIAARRGLFVDERRYLLKAVRREPYDATAWARLSSAALENGDRTGAYRAALKAESLDPLNQAIIAAVAVLQSAQAIPAASATATGTPLGASNAAGPGASRSASVNPLSVP